PFFVRETVRSLTTDALSAGHLRVFEVRLPEGARDVLRRRLSLLPEAAQQTLRAASGLGVQFEITMLGAMVDLSRAALLAALGRAHRESGHPAAARGALDRVIELSAIAGASDRWAKAARLELERLS